MRVALLPWNSTPGIDRGYRHNIKYVEPLVEQGLAFKLSEGLYQMYPPEDVQRDRELKTGSMTDWVTRRVSYLPDGETLRITTKQLNA